jgi:hypothetical protein
MILCSCQGEKDNIDGPLSELPRTRDLTESLIAEYRVGTLWDKFGIVSDVVVSISDFRLSCFHRLLHSHSRMTSNVLIFMSFLLQISYIN